MAQNSTPADPRAVHVSLLAGLLSHVGLKDPEKPRVRGRPGRPLRDRPGLGAVQEVAALGDGGRAGGDLAAVGAHRRPHRAGVDRAARGAPGQAHVQRAALGAQAGCGAGLRAGHPVRPADRGAAQGELRPDRPGRWRASCSSATRWSRATGTPTTRSSPRTGGCSTRWRSWSTGRAGATSSSTTRPCSTSTTSASPPRWSRPGTSTAGGSGPGAPTRTCSPSPPPCWSTPTAGGVDHRGLPGLLVAGRAAAAAELPVRAGYRGRRRDRAHSAARAGPGAPGRVRLAGAGVARGAGHRAAALAAQADPPQLRAGARPRPRRARSDIRLWTAHCSTRWSGSCAA